MEYRAVIFDLGSTLYPETSRASQKITITRIAAAVSVPPADFEPLWNAGFQEQMHGGLMTCQEYINHICKQIGVSVSRDQLTRGAEVFSDSINEFLCRPRPEAEDVLSSIKATGLKNGLVSNAASYVADNWKTSPIASFFDTAVFSCSVGMRKPDPRIYLLAINNLSIKPHECLYIADGKYEELSGASSVGMKAIQLRAPGETDNDTDRQSWNGTTISSLKEVPALLL